MRRRSEVYAFFALWAFSSGGGFVLGVGLAEGPLWLVFSGAASMLFAAFLALGGYEYRR